MQRGTTFDHYATLGVSRTATPQEIKKAYRERAKRYHPDRDSSTHATRAFMAAHDAYEVLMDPLQRLAYDATLQPRHRDPAYRPGPRPMQATMPKEEERTDMKTRHWAFFGLHFTGLIFGLVLVLGLMAGIIWRDWPKGAIFFVIPGVIVLPDAWAGLRLWFGRRAGN